MGFVTGILSPSVYEVCDDSLPLICPWPLLTLTSHAIELRNANLTFQIVLQLVSGLRRVRGCRIMETNETKELKGVVQEEYIGIVKRCYILALDKLWELFL